MEQQAAQQQQAGAQPQTQTGILLLQNGVVPPRVELPVPRPPPPPALPNPRDYAHLLPSVPAGALRAWVAPATTRLAPRIIIIGDPRDRAQLAASGQLGRRELNGQAVFLDVALDTGFGRQICGSALALCAEPGADLTMERYNALDEVLRGPLMGPYERGAPPSDGDWARLARVLAERTADQERWKAERDADPEQSVPRCAACAAANPGSRCGRCLKARYCSEQCQREHYPQHKVLCRSLAAAYGHGGA